MCGRGKFPKCESMHGIGNGIPLTMLRNSEFLPWHTVSAPYPSPLPCHATRCQLPPPPVAVSPKLSGSGESLEFKIDLNGGNGRRGGRGQERGEGVVFLRVSVPLLWIMEGSGEQVAGVRYARRPRDSIVLGWTHEEGGAETHDRGSAPAAGAGGPRHGDFNRNQTALCGWDGRHIDLLHVDRRKYPPNFLSEPSRRRIAGSRKAPTHSSSGAWNS